jgi:hypothetical protein
VNMLSCQNYGSITMVADPATAYVRLASRPVSRLESLKGVACTRSLYNRSCRFVLGLFLQPTVRSGEL